MYDRSLPSAVPSSNTGGAASELVPDSDSYYNTQVRLERRAHLERLSTPTSKKAPRKVRSMTSLLGDKYAFSPKVYLAKKAAAASQESVSGEAGRTRSERRGRKAHVYMLCDSLC